MKNIKAILVCSLVLNLLFIGGGAFFVYTKGGINYIKSKVVSADKLAFPLYEDKVSYFKDSNIKDVDIVFIGDSQIDNYQWEEKLKGYKVLNRGIAGDTTQGVLNRLDTLEKENPKYVFIQVGINDIQQNVEGTTIINNYKNIIKTIKKELPNAKISVVSVLPVSDKKYTANFVLDGKEINEKVIQLDKGLKEIVSEYSVQYLDNYSVLKNGNELNSSYTNDGLHLTETGYKKYLENVGEVLNEK